MKRLVVPDLIGFHGVTAFFTGKDPGVCTHEISRVYGIEKENIYLPVQKHTDKVLVLGPDREPVIADAVITKERGVLVGIKVADCVPVLIYERKKGVMGAVHAGWRGTAEGILKKTIKTAIDRFSCEGRNFVLAIGPSIRGCCYSVDHDVIKSVRHATGEGDYYRERGGKYCLDLAMANKYQAVSAGVPESNIWISGDCTYCNPDRYFSYRYARGAAGRQGAFIGRL